jgi:hypothetical protein
LSGTGEGSVTADAQVTVAADAQIQGQATITASADVNGADPPYTDQTFLMAFPEFNDASKYPYPQRQMWFKLALAALDPIRWGDYYEIGLYLFTAHHLAILGGDNKGKAGRPGQVPFPTGSKSVGSVSVSYDTSILSALISQGAGFWGLSMFGMRFWQLVQMTGMGGVQIGIGPLPQLSAGPGFYGPDLGYGGLL